jgi:hypothetical protein
LHFKTFQWKFDTHKNVKIYEIELLLNKMGCITNYLPLGCVSRTNQVIILKETNLKIGCFTIKTY